MLDELAVLSKTLRSMVFGGGSLPNEIIVEPVTTTHWEKLENGCEIKGIEMPEDYDGTCVLYKAKAGTLSPKHYHNSTESIICLGNCIIDTPFQIINLEYNDSHTIEAGVAHQIKFITDTVLIITWYPKIKYKAI